MSELVRHLEAEKSARALFEELLVKTDVGARLSGLEYENQVLRQQLLDKSDSEHGAGHWVLGTAVLCAVAGLCAAGLCALCKLLASASSLKGEASSPPHLLTVLEDLRRDVGQLKVQEQESASTKSEIRALPELKELEAIEQKLSRALESQILNLREEVESLEQRLSRAVESQVQNLREELGSSGKFLQQGLEDLRMEVARVASQEPQLERKTDENKAELGRVNSEIVGLREEVESLEEKLSRAVESQVQNLREELGSSVKSEGKSLQQGLEDLRMEVARVASQEPQLERKTNENKAELGRVNSEIIGLREESEMQAELTKLGSSLDHHQSVWQTSKTIDVSSVDFSGFGKGPCWDSECFELGGVRGLCFRLFPKGQHTSADGHCALYLCLQNREVKGVRLKYKYTLTLDGISRTTGCFERDPSTCGFRDFALAKVSYTTLKVELLEAYE